MVIEESDFRLTNDGGNFWDLELLYKVQPKGKPAREEFKDAGYGMTLEHCISKIINHRLDAKEDSYTLKEFLEAYKKEVVKLENLIKR